MFSGIIQTTGIVKSVTETGTTRHVTIASPISDGLKPDQSISHDGVCLTVVSTSNGTHAVDIIRETLSKTTFIHVAEGQIINLEKSITPATLLDGHLVQGHVDTTLLCLEKKDMNGSWNFRFNLPKEFIHLVIPHGSICLNGVSLTVARLDDESFEVAIIPYTYQITNFQFLKPGDMVNVEFDIIGKYIAQQIKKGVR
jgi:riboflavin synthase